MLPRPFSQASSLMKIIVSSGYSAYIVGGAVRDYLLNHDINDLDITTSALPTQIMELFPKVIPVGLEHGTVLVRHNKTSFEITTYKDGATEIKEDLGKRDFTINAIAINLQGDIIDFYNGQEDLSNGLIKSVEDPTERFNEDPLRIIRGLRFSSQFGFTVETHTLSKMIELKGKIKGVAIERLNVEMSKFFQGQFLNNGLQYLIDTELQTELPIFDRYPNLIKKIPSNVTSFNNFTEVIALLHILQPNIAINDWIKSWKCSNDVKKDVNFLVKSVKYFTVNGLNNYLLYILEFDLIDSFCFLVSHLYNDDFDREEIVNQKKKISIQKRSDMNISGYDIIEMFPSLNGGKWIEELIKEVENEIIFNRLNNNKNEIKEWIKCNPPETN